MKSYFIVDIFAVSVTYDTKKSYNERDELVDCYHSAISVNIVNWDVTTSIVPWSEGTGFYIVINNKTYYFFQQKEGRYLKSDFLNAC